MRVLSVSASNIGLRRTFQRPIVVGVRGVFVKVNVNDPVFTPEPFPFSTTNKSGEISWQTNYVRTPWMPVIGLGSATQPVTATKTTSQAP